MNIQVKYPINIIHIPLIYQFSEALNAVPQLPSHHLQEEKPERKSTARLNMMPTVREALKASEFCRHRSRGPRNFAKGKAMGKRLKMVHLSGQIRIIHTPEIRPFWDDSPYEPWFQWGRSEVVIIHPDLYRWFTRPGKRLHNYMENHYAING